MCISNFKRQTIGFTKFCFTVDKGIATKSKLIIQVTLFVITLKLYFYSMYVSHEKQTFKIKSESEDEGHWKLHLISSGSWKFINIKIWNARSTIIIVFVTQ